ISSPHRAHPDPHSFPTRRSSDLDAIDPAADVFAGQPIDGLEDLYEHVVGDVFRPGAVAAAEAHAQVVHLVAVTGVDGCRVEYGRDRKSTRLNSSHVSISYAVFCLKK